MNSCFFPGIAVGRLRATSTSSMLRVKEMATAELLTRQLSEV
jgi:hypothetical protein